MGAGKTTLLGSLRDRPPLNLWGIEFDKVRDFHPEDPTTYEEADYLRSVAILGIHTEIALEHGRNVLVDTDFQNEKHVDTFLRTIQRTRAGPNVILLRLTARPETAVARKTTLPADWVRGAHQNWQPLPIQGEWIVATDGFDPEAIAHRVITILLQNRSV